MNLAAVFFVSLFVFVQCDDDNITYADVVKPCKEKSGITDEILVNASKGNYDNPKLETFLLCSHKALGFQNEAGQIQIDAVERVLKKSAFPVTQVQKVVQQCNSNKATPGETAIEFSKCSKAILHPKPQ
ncbi:B1 protein-like [Zophobas morio]|uniref:B1 protein-like n=1 Tax=Zophobas morio TaxID=2755281 RepID=UPI00308362BA